MLRYYTYGEDSYYSGFVDGTEPTSNFTLIEPETDDNIFWDGTSWTIPDALIPTLDEIKADKIGEARQYFDDIVANASSDSAEFEVSSWETQRHEWMLYQSDVNALTPYCDTLAGTRGVTKEYLMSRIGANVTTYAYLQGQLHSLEDAITSCETEAQVEQIVW